MIKLNSKKKLLRNFKRGEKKETKSCLFSLQFVARLSFWVHLQKFSSALFPLPQVQLFGLGREGWGHFSKLPQGGWKVDATAWFPQFVEGVFRAVAGFKNSLYSRPAVIATFATSSNRVRKYAGGVLNDNKTDITGKRWKSFKFQNRSSPRQKLSRVHNVLQISFSAEILRWIL